MVYALSLYRYNKIRLFNLAFDMYLQYEDADVQF